MMHRPVALPVVLSIYCLENWIPILEVNKQDLQQVLHQILGLQDSAIKLPLHLLQNLMLSYLCLIIGALHITLVL